MQAGLALRVEEPAADEVTVFVVVVLGAGEPFRTGAGPPVPVDHGVADRLPPLVALELFPEAAVFPVDHRPGLGVDVRPTSHQPQRAELVAVAEGAILTGARPAVTAEETDLPGQSLFVPPEGQ